ncbi:MAG: hemerythrin domain-containing protein [Proteobacteria bacterium]|nr:hemerythrin domain-containing protein [Pseudomonadota bacterium]
MRYRFYRVHKYVCFEIAEFDHATARTDFSDQTACFALKEKLINLIQLLKHHGEYEDAHIHDLLRQKNSSLQLAIEREHQEHEQAFNDLIHQLDNITTVQDHSEKIPLGNDFYLSYRLFYSEMLKHLYDEEKILLPELQALYSDEELAQLQAKTYQKMTPEQMLGMLNVLFSHVNPEDMRFFINEMKAAEPEKFKIVWEGLSDDYKQLISRCDEGSLAHA